MNIQVRRGRPRNEACTGDILEATLQIVAEVGIAGLTMDAVAAQAGVGKATIYRRWTSKEALMLDAWMVCVRKPPEPDTGTLQGDLEVLMGGIDSPLSDRELQRVFPQMIAAAKVNPEVAEAYAAFVEQRRTPLRAVLSRAVERGEIDPSADLNVVQDMLVAPIMYRWIVTDAPIDDAVIKQIIATVTAGIAVRSHV